MAGGRGRGGAQDGEVRRRLLVGATELFSRKGYAATTVREIVAASGVTKPVLYYYFRSKEGIFIELMREAWGAFEGEVDAYRGGKGTAAERILRLGDRVYVIFAERIDVARVMYSIYYGPPQGSPYFDFDAFHLKILDAMRGLAEEGIRNGEFRKVNAEDLTWALLGAVNVAMELELCHPEMGIGREGLARILKLILGGAVRGKAAVTGRRR